MKYVFGYAGIPAEIFDEVYKKRSAFAGGNVEFEGSALLRGYTLDPNQGVKILTRLKDRAVLERFNADEKISYGVILVRPPGSDTSRFERVFFPSTFVYPVEWVLDQTDKRRVAQTKNELIELLRIASVKLKAILLAMNKELREKASRTSLLLPLRNFRSDYLCDHIQEVQAELLASDDPTRTIQELVKAFEQLHPLKKIGTKKRPCFVDDFEVEFHSPGSALHGLPRPTSEHRAECILNSLRRLGAQYNPAFHYDCMKGNLLKGAFHDCHSQDAYQMTGKPHLNIAPNDFVRI